MKDDFTEDREMMRRLAEQIGSHLQEPVGSPEGVPEGPFGVSEAAEPVNRVRLLAGTRAEILLHQALGFLDEPFHQSSCDEWIEQTRAFLGLPPSENQ